MHENKFSKRKKTLEKFRQGLEAAAPGHLCASQSRSREMQCERNAARQWILTHWVHKRKALMAGCTLDGSPFSRPSTPRRRPFCVVSRHVVKGLSFGGVEKHWLPVIITSIVATATVINKLSYRRGTARRMSPEILHNSTKSHLKRLANIQVQKI